MFEKLEDRQAIIVNHKRFDPAGVYFIRSDGRFYLAGSIPENPEILKIPIDILFNENKGLPASKQEIEFLEINEPFKLKSGIVKETRFYLEVITAHNKIIPFSDVYKWQIKK